jgi:hypothetical protein
MTSETKFEWRGRMDFAEVAEALGVPSDMVMAVQSTGVAIWTEGVADDDPMWWARIGRDSDDVIVVGPRIIFGTVGELNDRLADAMREAFPEGG